MADDAVTDSSAAADKPKVATNRPAETLTAAGALGVLIAQFLGLDDPEILTALIVLIGVLPAGVTWLVELGRKWEGQSAVSALASANLPYVQQRALRKSRVGDSSWNQEVEAARTILGLQSDKDGKKEEGQQQPQKEEAPPKKYALLRNVLLRKAPAPPPLAEMNRDLIKDKKLKTILESKRPRRRHR